MCQQCQWFHIGLPLLHRDGDDDRLRAPRHHRPVSGGHHAAAAASYTGVDGQRLHGEQRGWRENKLGDGNKITNKMEKCHLLQTCRVNAEF